MSSAGNRVIELLGNLEIHWAIEQSITRLPDYPITRFQNLELYRSTPAPGDDVREAAEFEARAAYQRAVHVGLGDELADIVRFHAAAVDHVAQLGRRRAKP